jgi:uncharacterized zinc-type alcohol dehydrogenase-like protein
MRDFCARHGIAPVTERLPLSRVSETPEHPRAGTARCRILPDDDLG